MRNYKLISYSLLSLFAIACTHSHEEHSHSEEDAEEAHDHGDEIVLHAEDAEKFGVKTTVIEPNTFYEVLTVSGQVLNTPTQSASIIAPKAGTVVFGSNAVLGNKLYKGQPFASISVSGVSGGDVSAAAKARIAAAKRELDRLTPLLAEGIITKGELNAAQAEYDQAVAAYSPAASSGAAVAPISGVITAINVRNGEFVQAGQSLADISESTEITIRADVPATAVDKSRTFSGANMRPAGGQEWISINTLGGNIKSNTGIASNSGYEPVYIELGNTKKLVPGTYVEIALMSTPRPNVISVPVSAISEQQGSKFVFVKVDDDGYEKVPVTTGASNGIDVEILSGLTSGQEIVCEGTVFVRLAETSGNVPEGHSHNH